VDDELAKKVGAESAEIMKARLKVLIGKQLEEAQRNEYREQMSHLLLEHASFEIPGSLLYTEIQHRSKQLFGSTSFKKKYETLSEEEKKEEFKKVETQAKDALKLFYICKKILTDNNIQITSKDINQEVETPLDAMFADRELANPNKTEEEKNLLMSRILLSKAQDFIIDKLLAEKSKI
jgi:FKBP-type peptidyl-prolyl cis-trans isomerase (trigger factor)